MTNKMKMLAFAVAVAVLAGCGSLREGDGAAVGAAGAPVPGTPAAGVEGSPEALPADPGLGTAGGLAAPGDVPALSGEAPAGLDSGADAAPVEPSAVPAPERAPAAGDRTGITDKEIRIGLHGPISGLQGNLTAGMVYGADAYFRWVNDRGGVHGRTLKVIVEDDGYDPVKAAGAAKKLMDQDKVFALVGPGGTDQIMAITGEANRRGVPYLHQGTTEKTIGAYPRDFAAGPSFPYFSRKMAEYVVNRLGGKTKKAGVIAENSPWFKEVAEVFVAEVQRLGGPKPHVEYIDQDQTVVTQNILRLQQSGAEMVYVLAGSEGLAQLGPSANAQNYRPRWLFGHLALDSLQPILAGGGQQFENAVGLQWFHRWNQDLGATKSFREVYPRYYPNRDPEDLAFWSFATASILVKGLEQAGPELSRERLVEAMREMGRFDNGMSAPVHYEPGRQHVAGNTGLCEWKFSQGRWVQVGRFASSF